MLKFDGKNIQALTNSNRIISESSRHLKNKPTHAFIWDFLMGPTIPNRMRKNLEALFIALSGPFRNGVSW